MSWLRFVPADSEFILISRVQSRNGTKSLETIWSRKRNIQYIHAAVTLIVIRSTRNYLVTQGKSRVKLLSASAAEADIR